VSSALGVEAAIVNGPVKMLFRRQRPVGHERPHHLRTPRTSSFPSGHASAGMFAAVLFAARTRRRWPWYILGALMGWSRVHVKIHHPSDVIGGAAVGLVLGRVGLWALEALDPVSA
jgi:undecaprenyl-diphosphatase